MRVHRRIASLGAILMTAALIAAGAVVLTSAPAGAVTVSTEAELQAAFGSAVETEIVLANDVDLTCGGGGDLTRANATSVTIMGNGFAINQTCAGQRVMDKNAGGGTLTLDGVTLTGGDTSGDGGAVRALGTNVVITSSTITGNTTSSAGFGGGAVLAGGDVTVTGSTISDNHATAHQGGGIWSSSNVSIASSTFSGNTASGFAGAVFASGDVTVDSSTFSENSGSSGGAITTSGGVVLTNSTLSNNVATDSGGAIRTLGADATLVYSTVVQNSSPSGANVAIDGVLHSFGSVVALPAGGGENCAVDSSASNGYNFSDDASCGFGATGDRESAGDPDLGALADNGGPTATRLPGSTSPLLDAIPTVACQDDGAAGVTTDQRGVSRPQGSACDIGAVEVEVAAPPTPPPSPPAAGPLIAVITFTG